MSSKNKVRNYIQATQLSSVYVPAVDGDIVNVDPVKTKSSYEVSGLLTKLFRSLSKKSEHPVRPTADVLRELGYTQLPEPGKAHLVRARSSTWYQDNYFQLRLSKDGGTISAIATELPGCCGECSVGFEGSLSADMKSITFKRIYAINDGDLVDEVNKRAAEVIPREIGKRRLKLSQSSAMAIDIRNYAYKVGASQIKDKSCSPAGLG